VISSANSLYDGTGHYARNDMFQFKVDPRSRRSPHDVGAGAAHQREVALNPEMVILDD
jgi:hypothetical protein